MTAEPRAHSIPLLSLIPGLGQSAERDVVAEANEQRYRDFLEALGVAMYTTDANGRITSSIRQPYSSGGERRSSARNGAGRGGCSGPTVDRCPMTSAQWLSRSAKIARRAATRRSPNAR